MSKESKIYISLLVIIVALVSFVPVIHVGLSIGKEWKGIVPEYIEDSSYYYARLHDVVRGYPFIGNPYFIEHKDEIPPAFFISDWLASFPFLVGFPFSVSVVFNILLWSLIFVLILYFLFRSFGMTNKISVLFSLVVYLQVFWLFVRPVSMQVIFPAYLLFLSALLLWLDENQSKKRQWFLLGATLYSIYVYTYLMQIVVVTYGLLILYYLYSKTYKSLISLGKVLSVTMVCSIPFLIITFFQVSHPLYMETLVRIGFMETHIPRMELYYYGRWIVYVLLLWFFSRKFILGFKNPEYEKLFVFFLLTGLSLLITAGSNIISGKELELANHMGRFITLWFPMAFVSYLYVLYKNLYGSYEIVSLYKKIFIGASIIIGIIVMFRNIPRAFPFFRNTPISMTAIQSFKEPLIWLEKNVSESSVIWSPNNFSIYIPIETKHYVLFHPSAFLQIVSDKELEERYLISMFLEGGPTRKSIEEDVGLYGGAGKALRGPVMQEHFDGMYAYYKKDIEPNINKYLAKYNVSYIVLDLSNPVESSQISKLKPTEVYRDKNFVIYSFLP